MLGAPPWRGDRKTQSIFITVAKPAGGVENSHPILFEHVFMTNSLLAVVFTIVLSGLLMVARAAPPSEGDFQPVEKLPVVKDLPDPFIFNDGTRMKSKEDWPRRRAELQAAILYYEYGRMPPAPGNTAGVELVSSGYK